MAAPRVRLGDLLVEAQMITRQQLDEVLERQREDRRRLGTLLVESGLVSETQVTQILSQQLSVPWVSLYHIDFSRQLLNLVPSQVVERFCLVPIFVRRVRGLGQTLYVAMDDPTDESALDQVRQFSGLPVRAMIAPPSDIRAAIRVYYGASTGSAEGSDPMAVPTTAEPKRPPPKPPQPPRQEAHSELDIDVEVEESPEPALAVTDGPPASETAPPSTKLSASEPPAATDEDPPQGETEPPPAMAGAPSVNIPPSSHPPSGTQPEAPLEVAPEASADLAPEDIPTEAPPAVAEVAREPQGGFSGLEPTPSSRAPSQPDEPPRSLTPVPESSRVPARDAVMPQPRAGKTPRMVSLTLLDGTTINLPARSAQSPRAEPEAEVEPPAAGEDQLTARDLIAALRAVSHGADATEILGENARWESMFAALLSLLLKKRLIADWEFVEEYKRV